MSLPSIASSFLPTGLGSRWDGLNPHLIASFWEVDKKGKTKSPLSVFAPLTQAEMEVSLQWQSAFEDAGAESKAPALMAMLQSGALQPVMAALGLGGGDGKAQEKDSKGGATASSFLSEAEGRTGITKINSTQVFVGMAPVKFTVTALFRAWLNPVSEVQRPYDQLMNWALPIKLSPDGMVVNAINAAKGKGSFVETLMPSVAPTMVAMRYKGRTYAPLVIESIGQPMDSPIDGQGNYTQMAVPLTLASLAAWDRQDWANTKSFKL